MPFVHDFYFLQLLVHNTNKKQLKPLIKAISSKQKSDLHHIAKNILKENIKLGKSDINRLKKFKALIRKLGANKKFSTGYLIKNIKGLINVVKTFLTNETYSKNSSNSTRKMGTNQRPKKRSAYRCSNSNSSSEWESITSESETGESSTESTTTADKSQPETNNDQQQTEEEEKEEKKDSDEGFNF